MRGPRNTMGAGSDNPLGRSTSNRVLRVLAGTALVFTAAYGIFIARSGFSVARRPSNAAATRLEPVFLAAGSEDGTEGEASPADSDACQTIVFFHIPKTGGESLNDLWRDKPNSHRLFGWAGYRWIGLRTTGLGIEQQKRVMTNL